LEREPETVRVFLWAEAPYFLWGGERNPGEFPQKVSEKTKLSGGVEAS
jgi:hypothetical protein